MAGERKYTRIPPESTGDRILLLHTQEVAYTSLTPGYVWKRDITYTITGGATPITIRLHRAVVDTSTTGYIVYDIAADQNYLESPDPIAGNDIREGDASGTIVAQTNGSPYCVYINGQSIVGKDNSTYATNVDRFGSLYTRFAEGAPQLDAFGKLRVSNATILGDYIFANDILPSQFSTRIVGNATATWDPNPHALLITNTTASGDLIAHTTNTYHHYFPGSSHTFVGTVAMSAGQTNLQRRWGMFDSEDGFMFVQIDGTFGINIRSKVTGSVVNTTVNQSDFNVDTLDGSGDDNNPSGFNIDLTKDNIYWIDVQWLGAGRTRFGCYNERGERLVMHEVRNANQSNVSITTTGALPVCYVQYNDGVIGNTAEFRAFCAMVASETTIDPQTHGRVALATMDKTIPEGSSTSDYLYVATLSPEEFITGTNYNRSLYYPSDLDVMAFDASGNDARIELEVYAEPVLSGMNRQPVEQYNPDNTVEIDTAATYYGPSGYHIMAAYINGHNRINMDIPDASMSTQAFKNYSEIGGTRTCNIAAITAANPAQVTITHPFHLHREDEPIVIDGVVGTMSTLLNGNTYYLKINGVQTAQLYTDAAFTSPVDTTTLTYTSGGTMVGYFGTQLNYTILAKPITPANTSNLTTDDIDVKVMLSWKEINQ